MQVWAVILPLLAFLIVGLVVSAKIGGGGDLHNLDMFLIGLVFAAGVAWKAWGQGGTARRDQLPSWLNAAILLLVVLPANSHLQALRPISFARDAQWLTVLTDVERPRDLGSLPDHGEQQ